MSNFPIGIFDSGVGGLSILLTAQKILPKESFVYLADQKNFPYGEKKREKIREICFENTKFLQQQGCRVIIIACNTATVAAINWLRKRFLKISFVGVEPGVKPAGTLTKTGHMVILSTPTTQKSQRLRDLIKNFSSDKKIYNLGCPGLADLIEEGEIKGLKVTRLLKKCLGPALKDPLIDVLVLGCTHYFFVKKLLLELFAQKIKIITPAEPVAKQVKRVLKEKNLLADFKKQKNQFFTSGNVVSFNQIASKLTGFLTENGKI